MARTTGATHDKPQPRTTAIRKRKQADEVLRQEEQNLRVLVQNSMDAIAILNGDGTIRYESPAVERILGYKPEELIGKPMLEFLHPDDVQNAVDSFEASAANPGQTISMEVRFLHKDGSWRLFEGIGNNLLGDPDVNGIVVNYRDVSERKQMETELRESEEKLNRYLEGTPDAICVTDLRGTILYINAATERMTGYSREELVGNNFLKLGLLAPGTTEKPSQWLERGGAEKPTSAEEFELIRKDGSRLFAEVSTLTICPIAEGGKTEVVAIVRDITERKNLREAVQETERRYRAIFDNQIQMVYIHDEQGLFLDANDYALERLGFTRDDLGKKSFQDVIHPEDTPRAFEALADVLTNGFMKRPIELRIITRSGEMIWVQTFNVPLERGVDHYIGMGIAYDITDRERTEDALRELNKKYHLLADNITDAIFYFEPSQAYVLDFLYISPSAARIHGYTPEELMQQEVMMKMCNPGIKEMMDFWARLDAHLTSGDLEQTWTIATELELEHKDGHHVWIEARATLVHDPESHKPGIVGIAVDITERKRGEEERERLNAELAEKNREQEQIIYVTSHDLRSPLVNVQGFSKELNYSLQELAALLRSEDIPSNIRGKLCSILDSDVSEALKYIETSISKMDSLLSGLLRLSRLGRAALNFESLDMNSLLSDIEESFEYRIKEAGVKLEIGDLPPCVGDAVQINQVFSNLFDNALKYLEPSRPAIIRISGREDGDQAVYCIEDNGVGIAEEHQGKVFEIFHRLNPGASSGEGLGLSIVKKVLSRHSGNIWLESTPGVGTRFFVSLPAVK